MKLWQVRERGRKNSLVTKTFSLARFRIAVIEGAICYTCFYSDVSFMRVISFHRNTQTSKRNRRRFSVYTDTYSCFSFFTSLERKYVIAWVQLGSQLTVCEAFFKNTIQLKWHTIIILLNEAKNVLNWKSPREMCVKYCNDAFSLYNFLKKNIHHHDHFLAFLQCICCRALDRFLSVLTDKIRIKKTKKIQ